MTIRRLLPILLCILVLAPAGARAATGDLPDRIVVSGDVLVAKGESVGDVVVANGNVVIRGDVHGSVVAINGDVTIRGTVSGDVVTLAKHTTLGRRAHVGGTLRWLGDQPVVAPGAVIVGKVKKLDFESFGTPGLAVAGAFWLIVSISYVLGGLLLLWLAPAAADALVSAARARRGASVIAGVVLLILLPILAAALIVTVVGAPLGVGLLLALPPIYATGYVTSGLMLGRRLVKSGRRAVAFLAGIAVLRLLALVPAVGVLVSLIATVFGLGALFVAMRRARTA